jgi:hypothetical protein
LIKQFPTRKRTERVIALPMGRAALAVVLVLLAGSATAFARTGLAAPIVSKKSTASTAPSTVPAWALSKVHVHIASTSDWSTLQLSGPYLLFRKGAASGGMEATESGGGWSLSGSGSYDADVVLGVTTSDLTFTLEKGRIGALTVTLTSPRTPGPLLTVTDATHNTQGQHPNRQYASLSRAALTPAVTPHDELARGDNRKLTLAFAYPWFGSSYNDSKLTEKPAQPRSWFNADGVLSMTQQAKANGIDGFVMSYGGEGANGASLDRLLAAAKSTGSVVAPYLETASAVSQAGRLGNKQALVEEWLRSALQRSSNPAFLRLRGTPVVFVYQMEKLSVVQWTNVRNNLTASGIKVVLVGDATAAGYQGVMGGIHAYAATDDIATLTSRSEYASVLQRGAALFDPRITPPLTVATVSPGYDDRKTRGLSNPVVYRDGGKRYDQTWDAALAGSPDWVVVTSWNEWYEDTSIEPGTATGAQALAQTKQRARAWSRR